MDNLRDVGASLAAANQVTAADGGPMFFLILAPDIRAAVCGPSTHKQVSTFQKPASQP
jgi:hypothetical protein